jgi:photosystem II stability/assembly factor-like uncharacterized protein/PKD repeat protein
MKRSFLIFTATIIPVFSTFSQWIPFSGIPSEDIQCVRAYSSTNYYAGLENAIITTSDAGVNWQLKPVVDLAGNLQPCVVSDVYFTSPTNAIAVGFFAIGNTEAILRSTNGGNNWEVVNIYNGGNYPRMHNTIDFPSSLIGFVGGTNGRILKTINGGTTWSTTGSPISADINDLDFTGLTTGYAACSGYILRTLNGTSWTQTAFSGKNFKGINFPSTTVGYAVGDAGVIYKTVNSGGSWTQLVFPFNYIDFTSVYFTDDNTGYITGDNFIYRTTSGGQYWEKVEKPEDMNQVVFYSATEGLACGDVSQVYHTSNSGETYKPQPNFSHSPSISCYDSIVNLTNLSDPNWSFEWLLNGTVFSTAYSPSIVIPNAGNSIISLVAINGLERDTLSKTIVVQPSLAINLTLGVPNQICAGQSTTVTVTNSEFGVIYRLRNGTVNIGAQQSGNGGTLTFNTGVLSATTTLNVRATKTNSCGTSEQINYVTVIIQNPNINKVIYADPDTICPSTATNIVLVQSENSVIYKLMNGTNVIGVQQTGNSSNLTFPTAVLTANTPYFIRGTSPLGCITNFPTINVIVENPTIYTTFSNANPEVGESIEVINNTVNPNGSFQWDFGTDATPQFSTLQSVPALSFSTTGIKTINLTVTSSIGCLKYLTKTINVIDSFNLAACSGINYAGSATNSPGSLHALARDLDRNLFVVYENENVDSLRIYTGNNDLLVNYLNPIPDYNLGYTIVKHNAKGIPMWSTNLRFNTLSAKHGATVTDNDGNVYVAYHHADHIGDMRIYSTDGSYVVLDPPHSGSYFRSTIIVKYNTNGMFVWYKTILDDFGLEKVTIKIDESNNIHYCGEMYTKFDQNGVVLASIPTIFKSDCEPDGMGGAYVIPTTGLTFQYVGPGIGITPPAYTVTHPNTVISPRYIQRDDDNNYYIVGFFRGGFSYGGVNLVDVQTGGQTQTDVFICKVNSDGTPGWIKQFKVSAETRLRGFDVQNQTILLATTTSSPTYEYVGHSTVSNLSGFISNFLFKCNLNGGSDVLTLFHDEATNFVPPVGSNLVYLNPSGEKADFGFSFKTNFTSPSGVPFAKYGLASYANWGIHTGELNCLMNINPVPPVSEFSFDTLSCVDTDIQFTDESTNLPESWNWSFPGGTPASSTNQNPLVSYNLPGTYTIQLTTTNEFGQGTTTSHQLTIADVPVTNNCFTDDSICYSNQGIVLESPSPLGGSFSTSNGSISGQSFYPTASAQNTTNFVTYTYIDPVSGCPGTAVDSIFIYSNPVVNFGNFTDNSICYDSQGIVLGNSTPSGGQYSDVYNSQILNNVIYPPAAVFDSWFTVVYSYTDPLSGCSAADSDSIFVHSMPVAVFDSFSADSTCYSSQGIVLGSSTPAGGQYSDSWSSVVSNNTIFPAPAVSDSWYEVIYTYTDPVSGCTAFDSDSIFINQIPAINFAGFTDNSTCYSLGIPLGSASPSGGQYSDPFNSPIINNEIFPPVGAVNSWFKVTYIYTDPASNCYGNDSDSIFINPLPIVSFSNFTEDTICYVSQGIVLGNSLPAGGQYSDPLNSPIVNNVIYPQGAITNFWFEVIYTYTDQTTGCENFDSDSIYLDPCLGVDENRLNEIQLATIEMGLKYQVLNMDQVGTLKLFDSGGREIGLRTDDTYLIDLSNYASGMYLLKISDGNSMRTFKLLRH